MNESFPDCLLAICVWVLALCGSLLMVMILSGVA